MKIVTIVGARPQFIKAAALSREFKKSEKINEIIVHTGQHFDTSMSDVFFSEMHIPKPKYNLHINSLSHGAMTGRMLEKIEEILINEHPNYVLVYGDTNSTLAGALAAKKLHIKVIHVESGLRSFNIKMPEEINRILTDRISDILFCPTNDAISNLMSEGFEDYNVKIFNVGDVMQDAAIFYEKISDSNSAILDILKINNYYLLTLHRQENTDNISRFNEIIKAIKIISKNRIVVIPIHPRIKNRLKKQNFSKNVKLIEPVGYLDMISLIKNSNLIITDSGGLQKEAYFFNKFCVTTRDQTEWTELVNNGYNKLAGADSSKIISSVNYFESIKFIKENELYGGGRASKIIVEKILNCK